MTIEYTATMARNGYDVHVVGSDGLPAGMILDRYTPSNPNRRYIASAPSGLIISYHKFYVDAEEALHAFDARARAIAAEDEADAQAAYVKGYRASKRPNHATLDVCEARYIARNGDQFLPAWLKGWEDYSLDLPCVPASHGASE